jgi:release factor H-coupled RctB family protein
VTQTKSPPANPVRFTDLERNPFGGQVVCGNDHLLWEEAPGVYKDASSVIGDLEQARLIRVVAVMRPLVTFKCSTDQGPSARRDKAERMRQRRTAREAKNRRSW